VGALRLSRYRFRHILIQRYVYSSLDEVVRAYQHEAVGQALEVLYGAQASEVAAQLAWHFEEAQLPEKAAVYREQAGDQAWRSAALDAAIRDYQAALGAWPALDRAGRAGLLRKLGECQWVTGQLQDALATFEACQSLCESLGDREGAGAAQRLIGRIYWEQGDREQSLQHYYQALALLEQGPESVELAHAISAISQMHMLASDFGQAIAWGERALALAERLGAEDVMLHALNNVGVAYSWTGDPKRGEAMLRESLRRALDLGLPHDTCRAYLCLGETLTGLGRYAEARVTFEESQVYATRVHAPLYAGSVLVELTGLDWLAGRWRQALSRRQQIGEWLERSQSIGYLEVTASTLFGWMQNDLGQAHAAHQILEQELPKARSQAELQTTGPHLAQVARALVLLGMETNAADVVHELLELITRMPDFDPHNTVPLIFLCRWLAGSPTPGALDDAGAILLALERANAQIGGPETAAALSEARGMLALSEKEPLRALEQLRHAAADWQALGRPYDQARTLTDLGRVLILAGDAGEARTALDQALSLVESLAAQLDAAELKAAFLNSPLLQELRSARSAVLAAPPRNLVPQSTPSASRHTEQQIRFGTSPDGVRIAYAIIGAGPALVKAANWLSHLEFDWKSPVWRHWLAELARHHTLVRYDRRGCGLSDWNVKDMSLEARVQDLETVVTALKLDRFALLGLSGGGSVAIAYAVSHLEKVSHLVLYGSYARGRLKRELTPEQIEEVKTLRQVMQIGWGKPNAAFRQVYTTLFIPDGTPEQIHWFNDLQRISTSPEVAVRIAMADWSDDLTDLARQVAVPTLVLHAREDAVVPFEEGRRLAALIPGAQFVPLESKNHVLLENEPAWQRFLAEVHHFLERERL
jgi:pimeloyl-ACP methyl ester carboxylesterase/tetratricopeptide (TPR) repeat protein